MNWSHEEEGEADHKQDSKQGTLSPISTRHRLNQQWNQGGVLKPWQWLTQLVEFPFISDEKSRSDEAEKDQ